MTEKNQLKTGTTTIGVVCKDGIVLGADKRATAGNLIVDRKTNKVQEINDKLVITTAGSVSDIQLHIKLIRAELALKALKTNRSPSTKESANLLSSMVYNNIRIPSMLPGIIHFIIGGYDEEGCHIYDLFPDGSLTEIDDFIASGSGSVFAYGVLEALYKKDIDINEGVDLVTKAIQAAVSRDNASGSGLDVVTITQKDGINRVLTKEIPNIIE